MIPSCLFTDPQVATIGLTETEAGRQGISVRVIKLPMAAVLRTRTIDETRGFMKALIEPDGDRILCFTTVGSEAGEGMAVVQMQCLLDFLTRHCAMPFSRTPPWLKGSFFFFPPLSRRTPGRRIATLTCSRARPDQPFAEYEAFTVRRNMRPAPFINTITLARFPRTARS